MAGLYPSLSLYGKAYHDYIALLSAGETYGILTVKRLLIRPLIPIWIYLLGIFCIRNAVFGAMVTLPCLLICGVFLSLYFPLWRACRVSAAAYCLFHTIIFLILRGISIPISLFLEVLWT